MLHCTGNQKWSAVIPSEPGTYVGRGKWAAVLVIGGSVGADSLTTPSSLEDAQADRRHAIAKATTPQNAAALFTKPNVAIAVSDATPVDSALIMKSRAIRKKFCARWKARV